MVRLGTAAQGSNPTVNSIKLGLSVTAVMEAILRAVDQDAAAAIITHLMSEVCRVLLSISFAAGRPSLTLLSVREALKAVNIAAAAGRDSLMSLLKFSANFF